MSVIGRLLVAGRCPRSYPGSDSTETVGLSTEGMALRFGGYAFPDAGRTKEAT
jgi:hypothetical protein